LSGFVHKPAANKFKPFFVAGPPTTVSGTGSLKLHFTRPDHFDATL
jgi:hypothetical protein